MRPPTGVLLCAQVNQFLNLHKAGALRLNQSPIVANVSAPAVPGAPLNVTGYEKLMGAAGRMLALLVFGMLAPLAFGMLWLLRLSSAFTAASSSDVWPPFLRPDISRAHAESLYYLKLVFVSAAASSGGAGAAAAAAAAVATSSAGGPEQANAGSWYVREVLITGKMLAGMLWAGNDARERASCMCLNLSVYAAHFPKLTRHVPGMVSTFHTECPNKSMPRYLQTQPPPLSQVT